MHFEEIQGSRRSASEKPKMFDLDPDVPLADEYDEKEEAPEHVAKSMTLKNIETEWKVLQGAP